MSINDQLRSFVTRVAQEFKSLQTKVGALTSLNTASKTSLVSAINEVKKAQTIATGAVNPADRIWATIPSLGEPGVDGAANAQAMAIAQRFNITQDELERLTTESNVLNGRADTLDTDVETAVTKADSALSAISTLISDSPTVSTTNTWSSSYIATKLSDSVTQQPADWTATTGVTRIVNKPTVFVPAAHTHPSTDISDSTVVGRNLLTATNSTAARTAIVAAAATHTHGAADISDSSAVGRSVLTASSQVLARTAINAASPELANGKVTTTDNSVTGWALPANSAGFLLVSIPEFPSKYGIYAIVTGTSFSLIPLVVAGINPLTGVLTGTSGTATNVSISLTATTLYLENRTGTPINPVVFLSIKSS